MAQGFIPEEDAAFRKLAADYQKASGNKLDYSIVPFTPLRQKEVSAVTSGIVPDIMELPISTLPRCKRGAAGCSMSATRRHPKRQTTMKPR